MGLPEVRMIRNRSVPAIEALRRGIEQVEPVRDDYGNHFRGDTAPGKPLAHTKQTTGSCHRAKHGVGIDRLDRPEIDHLDVPAFATQLVRRLQLLMHHRAIGHDGGMPPRFRDPRPSSREPRFAWQRLSLEVIVEKLVLAEYHGIIDLDRFEEHGVGVLHRGGSHHDQARVMRVDGFQTLAVKGTAAFGAPGRQSHHDGTRNPRPIKVSCGLVHNLVERH